MVLEKKEPRRRASYTQPSSQLKKIKACIEVYRKRKIKITASQIVEEAVDFFLTDKLDGGTRKEIEEIINGRKK